MALFCFYSNLLKTYLFIFNFFIGGAFFTGPGFANKLIRLCVLDHTFSIRSQVLEQPKDIKRGSPHIPFCVGGYGTTKHFPEVFFCIESQETLVRPLRLTLHSVLCHAQVLGHSGAALASVSRNALVP